MPNFVDPIAVKNGSTEVTVLTTARALQNLASVSFSGITVTGGTYTSPVIPIETLVCSSAGVSPSSMVAYGISRIQVDTTGGDYSSSPRTVTLAAPITGVEKTIIFESTIARINPLNIDVGADVGVGSYTGTTNSRYILFSTLGTEYQAITMFGVSTALWVVRSVNSTVGGFGAATGIRASSIASTS